VQDLKKMANAQNGFPLYEKCIWIDSFKAPKGIYAKQKYTSNKMYKPLNWLLWSSKGQTFPKKILLC
jgi:hypothetical protein